MENIKSANVKISNQAKLKIKMSDKNDKDILSSKDTKSSKLKTYGIFLTGLGAVGLATFMILKKRGKIKTANLKARKNTKDSVSKNQNGALNVTEEIQDIKNKIQYDTAMVAQEMPVDSSDYDFMKRNIKGFYLENGKEINSFLRTGKLKDIPVVDENMPPALKKYAESQIVEIKNYNRAIVDSIEAIDAKMTSRAEKPMTLYRDAPASWLDTAENGILTDKAFCSTSVTPGASMEGIIGSNAHLNKRYEIRIPEGTPFLDLRHTSEQEVLLPRNCKFKIVGENVLELIS